MFARFALLVGLCGALAAAQEAAKPISSSSQVFVRQFPAPGFGFTGHFLQPFAPPPLPYVAAVAPLTAVAELRSYGDVEGSPDIKGRIMFVQPLPPHGPVFMAGNVTGLPSGKHGLTIHTFGDIEKGCKTMQHHYNPNLSNHGGPADPYRHVGDLGNIETGADGVARLQETDPVISLVGAQSILGRGLVVHEKPDDLGRGGDMESLRTGNSGGALACGVIGWTSAPFPPHNQLQDIPKDEKKEK